MTARRQEEIKKKMNIAKANNKRFMRTVKTLKITT